MTRADVGINLSLRGAQAVKADLRRIGDGFDNVGRQAGRLRNTFSGLGALGGLKGGAAGGILGAIAGGLGIQQFQAAADSVTILQNQLRLATGSTERATVAYEALFGIAQRSRVEFTQLGTTYAAIARASQELNLSQESLLSVTEAIGNAMTISGGNAQGMQAALMQLGQGLASGTLRGEELNSVMEQTPRLAQAIAAGLGVTTGELRAMGQAGLLTSEQVIGALKSQAAVLRDEVGDATMTVAQSFTMLGNTATVAVGEINRISGVSANTAAAIGAMSGAIDTVMGALRNIPSAARPAGSAMQEVFTDAAKAVAWLAVNIGFVTGAMVRLQQGQFQGAQAFLSDGLSGMIDSHRKTRADLARMLEETQTLNRAITGATPGGAGRAGGGDVEALARLRQLSQAANRRNAPPAPAPAARGGAATAPRRAPELELMGPEIPQQLEDFTRQIEGLISDTPIMKARALADRIDVLNRALQGGHINAEIHRQSMDDLTGATAAVAQASEDASRAQEEFSNRLNSLISDTPIAKTQELLDNLHFLDNAFMDGALSAEQHQQAVAKLTGSVNDLADSGTSDMQRLIEATEGWGRQFTDTLTAMVTGGKADFRSLADSIISDLIRIQIQRRITRPLVDAGTKLLNVALGGLLSFDGGGFTGSGPRIGGVDGRGGYPAILHPNETVIDHTRGSVRPIVVNQSFSFNGPADRTQVISAAQLGAAMARQQIRDDFSRGRM